MSYTLYSFYTEGLMGTYEWLELAGLIAFLFGLIMYLTR